MQSEAKQLGIKFFMKTYVIKKIIKIWKMGLYLGVIRSVKGMYFRKKWVRIGYICFHNTEVYIKQEIN